MAHIDSLKVMGYWRVYGFFVNQSLGDYTIALPALETMQYEASDAGKLHESSKVSCGC